MSSFRKVNYSLRPAKHAERRMMGEIFRRVTAFEPLERYSYVGLGSVWFSDFTLFHKILGVEKMISIEQAAGARARFEANKPFNIEMHFQTTNVALPALDWSRRAIAWMDYDGELTPDILSDCRTLAGRCRSGSIIAVSVNCGRAKEVNQAEKDENGPSALERFTAVFGRDRTEGVEDDQLLGSLFATLSRSLIEREIGQALAVRNAQGQDRYLFKRVAAFTYKDDAPMTTLVGVVHTEADSAHFENCNFASLDFLSAQEEVIDIKVPMLTIKEIRYLQSQLPIRDVGDLALDGAIPASDARAFAAMYRYFPNFAALES